MSFRALPSVVAAGENQPKVSIQVDVFSMSPSPTVAQIRTLEFMLLPISFSIHHESVVHSLSNHFFELN